MKRRANLASFVAGAVALIVAGPVMACGASLLAILAVYVDDAACRWYEARGDCNASAMVAPSTIVDRLGLLRVSHTRQTTLDSGERMPS